jgi:exodeoxyribonuclease V alpha subunit
MDLFSHAGASGALPNAGRMPPGVVAQQAADDGTVEIHAKINKVIFGPTSDGFTIYAVSVRGGKDTRIQVTSNTIADRGDDIIARGKWGIWRGQTQLKADMIQLDIPHESKGIVKWLKSGGVEGVSLKTALKLAGHFGEMLPDAVGDEAAMSSVIGGKKAALIAKAWNNHLAQPELIAMLMQVGLKPKQITKVIEMFGGASKKIVETDPWELLDVECIGFQTADSVARANRLDMSSPNRVKRGLFWVLSESLNREGHCAYPPGKLIERSARLLGLHERVIAANMDDFLENDRVFFDESSGLIYPTILWEAERDIAEVIGNMCLQGITDADMAHAARAVEAAERDLDVELDRDGGQFDAAVLAVGSRICVITGGPGTGKSTTQRIIVQARKDIGQAVNLGAPTGRAAKRLTDTSGQEAKTIHRLLEYVPNEGDFKFNRTRPLEADVIILDELSMTDVKIFASLVVALRSGASLVLVGDVDQLPSVGPGQVLRDLIQSGVVPVARLTRVHRQAEGSGIAIAAKRINEGHEPLAHGERLRGFMHVEARDSGVIDQIVRLVRSELPEAGFDPLRDVQVLSAMRKGECGVIALNAAIKEALNPALDDGRTQKFGLRAFTVGDRVMQTRNDYGKGIYNGEVGTVTSIDIIEERNGTRSGAITVDFSGVDAQYKNEDNEDIELAYAATIHRSQGCEFPVVIIIVAEEHRSMLIRNLIYTGITRAKTECHVVGSRSAVRAAVARAEGAKRYTGLKARIADYVMAA